MGFFFNAVTRYLDNHFLACTIYAFIVAFSTYFCMYAFRKPFTAAEFKGIVLWGVQFKILLITFQVIGYALSKFSGIIIISQLDRRFRGMSICGCILFAELTLVGFGAVPRAGKPFFMFLNGLPLGLIWGMVFSFVEGRRSSAILASGMCISFIVASGAVKAVGKAFLDKGVSQFWMPVVTGAVFLPFLVLSAYLLELIPDPNEEDVQTRTERVPMSRDERIKLFKEFLPGFSVMTFFYMTLSAIRDFRDNFAPELWSAFGYSTPPARFAVPEAIVSVIVSIPIILFTIFLKDNVHTLIAYHILIIFGMVVVGVLAIGYKLKAVSGAVFMVGSGAGLYFAYIPFSNIIWDLVLAMFKYKGTSGFLMYVCDSLGYTASTAVILVRNFAEPNLEWDNFYVWLCTGVAIIGVVAMAIALVYFLGKYRMWKHSAKLCSGALLATAT
jgi:hypothetical protein